MKLLGVLILLIGLITSAIAVMITDQINHREINEGRFDGAVIPICRTISGEKASGAYSCEAIVEGGKIVWRRAP